MRVRLWVRVQPGRSGSSSLRQRARNLAFRELRAKNFARNDKFPHTAPTYNRVQLEIFSSNPCRDPLGAKARDLGMTASIMGLKGSKEVKKELQT